MAVVWDEIDCKGWAGRRTGRLPLRRTRATPSWTRTHPHFPGPKETRLALQTNRRQICTSKYKVLECSPCYHTLYQNNWEKVVQEAGACNEISKFPSPELGGGAGAEMGQLGTAGRHLPEAQMPCCGRGAVVALRKAIEPGSLLRVGRGDHAHRPRVAAAAVVAWGLAWLCLMRHKTVAKASRLDAHQVLGAGVVGVLGKTPPNRLQRLTTPAAPQGLCLASWAAFSVPRSPQRWVQPGGPVTHFPRP